MSDEKVVKASEELLSCPFCGGIAEMDTQRGYLALGTGASGKAVAIYCTTCSADMSVCREDYQGWRTEELVGLVSSEWNKRAESTHITTLASASTAEWGKGMGTEFGELE